MAGACDFWAAGNKIIGGDYAEGQEYVIQPNKSKLLTTKK
jgi:hypothetical protein